VIIRAGLHFNNDKLSGNFVQKKALAVRATANSTLVDADCGIELPTLIFAANMQKQRKSADQSARISVPFPAPIGVRLKTA
jgi:hypothetical protein